MSGSSLFNAQDKSPLSSNQSLPLIDLNQYESYELDVNDSHIFNFVKAFCNSNDSISNDEETQIKDESFSNKSQKVYISNLLKNNLNQTNVVNFKSALFHNLNNSLININNNRDYNNNSYSKYNSHDIIKTKENKNFNLFINNNNLNTPPAPRFKSNNGF